jgi:aquaporin Z
MLSPEKGSHDFCSSLLAGAGIPLRQIFRLLLSPFQMFGLSCWVGGHAISLQENGTANLVDQGLTQSRRRASGRFAARCALRAHWPEYLMEFSELAVFMASACLFTLVLEHPASPVHRIFPMPMFRRVLMGLAMGGTLLSLFHSRWGKQSGAHMNPATTLMFFRLGKMDLWDAIFYIIFQFAGGLTGASILILFVGSALAHPSVQFAATQPGEWGTLAAFISELLITFVLATTVLIVSNHKKVFRFTPYFAATLVVFYITIEAPISGMSMNPARTLASAVPAHAFRALWIYFTAPPLAMLAAAELYLRSSSVHQVFCAKFNHHSELRCIFRCRYAELEAEKI